ncbi:sulfurtransferase TusA family protein [Couchioplanes azureus]|uniref:sulfurtransferase TusA family protein n=1 Tax=Couchioplanes caeruleus TaxID=56438 RepID=UPI0019AEDADD|nr:sulfurtransferase TusA family protein [Couchioplanes caeruleus]GGQ39086.1 hypothetical protein GCM10010166_02100 [Couchioplanes caeruleus subsp. azureus]
MSEPVILDGGDRSCVQLLLELRRLVSEVPAGTVIHLEATDPAAPLDLPAWCHLTGHHYLGAIASDPPAYGIETAATASQTDPAAPWRPSQRVSPDRGVAHGTLDRLSDAASSPAARA